MKNDRPFADMSKAAIEFPIKGAMALLPEPPPLPTPTGVAWHPSFDVAVEAARKSGRPVMLFQLLGRFDDEFC